nr:hypothetical protein [Endozoicomonas sp.]
TVLCCIQPHGITQEFDNLSDDLSNGKRLSRQFITEPGWHSSTDRMTRSKSLYDIETAASQKNSAVLFVAAFHRALYGKSGSSRR